MKDTTPIAGTDESSGEDHRSRDISCGEVFLSVIRSFAEPRIDSDDISDDRVTSSGIGEVAVIFSEVK